MRLLDQLTDNEYAVLTAVATGATNYEIAAGRGVSEQTAKFHVGNIYRKLGVANRVKATLIYLAEVGDTRITVTTHESIAAPEPEAPVVARPCAACARRSLAQRAKAAGFTVVGISERGVRVEANGAAFLLRTDSDLTHMLTERAA